MNTSLAYLASCIVNPAGAREHQVPNDELAGPELRALGRVVADLVRRREPLDLESLVRGMAGVGSPLSSEARRDLELAVEEVVGPPGVWAPRVRDEAWRREQHKLLNRAMEALAAGRDSELVEGIVREAAALPRPTRGDSSFSISEAVRSAYEDDRAEKADGVVLPIGGLDEVFGRLEPGDTVVIGADTNVGKSLFALNLAVRLGVASKGRAPATAAYITLEDGAARVRRRLRSVVEGFVTLANKRPATEEAVKAAADTIAGRVVPVRGRVTELEVAAAMHKAVEDHGAQLAIVDYLQVCQRAHQGQDRRNEMREVFVHLKDTAIALGIPLVLLSQVTVPPDPPPTWVPTKHSLKESRDIANGAEAVVVLWRPRLESAVMVARVVKAKDGGNGHTVAWRNHGGWLEPEARDREAVSALIRSEMGGE